MAAPADAGCAAVGAAAAPQSPGEASRGRQVFDDQWRLIEGDPLRRPPAGPPPDAPATPRRLVVELADTAVQTVPLSCASVSVQTSPAVSRSP